MPLPKLSIPVYETKLPSTGETIKYRPFLVKEEKILLTALESNENPSIMLAISNIISNCVQSDIKIKNLPTFDIEYLFLQLRAKSVGESINIGLSCKECQTIEECTIDLNDIQVHMDEEHTKKIMLNDTIGIMMRYPKLDSIERLEKDPMNVIQECVDMIFTAEETHENGSFTSEELDEFIDSLNTEQFGKIKQFFDTMPSVKHDVSFICKNCETENEITLEGLNSFFASA